MAHKVYQLQKGRWIEIEEPTQEDQEFLRQEFPQFHPTNIEDSMLRVRRPKLDLYENYMFISDTVPSHLTPGQRAKNFEISLFLTEDAIITVTHEKTNLLKKEKAEKEQIASSPLPDTPGLLAYRFFEILYDTSNKTIDQIDGIITYIDKNILNVRSSAIIRDISILQRNIIYFMTSLEASIPNYEEIERKNVSFGNISMKEYWGDIVDKLRQQKDLLEDYDKLLTKLAKAHENYLGHHTNHVINVLTVFSVILLPLNLIAGIFGMNFVDGSGISNAAGFYWIMVSMVVLGVAMFAYFKSKKWI